MWQRKVIQKNNSHANVDVRNGTQENAYCGTLSQVYSLFVLLLESQPCNEFCTYLNIYSCNCHNSMLHMPGSAMECIT